MLHFVQIDQFSIYTSRVYFLVVQNENFSLSFQWFFEGIFVEIKLIYENFQYILLSFQLKIKDAFFFNEKPQNCEETYLFFEEIEKCINFHISPKKNATKNSLGKIVKSFHLWRTSHREYQKSEIYLLLSYSYIGMHCHCQRRLQTVFFIREMNQTSRKSLFLNRLNMPPWMNDTLV